MFQSFIAWKYLTSRFITIAAFLLVSISVAILIILLAIMEGFRTEMIDRIRGTSADLKVDSTKFDGLESPDRVQSIIEAVEGVRAASPYVETMVLYEVVRFPRTFNGHLQLVAFDPEIEGWEGRVDEYVRNAGERHAPSIYPPTASEILARKWIERDLWEWNRERLQRWKERRKSHPGPPDATDALLFQLLPTSPPEDVERLEGILIGDEAFRQYGLRSEVMVGRVLSLKTVSPVTNQICSERFIIAGTFKSNDVEADNAGLIMGLDTASEFLELTDPRSGRESVSGLRVYTLAGHTVETVREALEKKLVDAEVPFVRVRTWRDEKEKMLGAVGMEKTIMGIILGIIVIFVGLMVFIILTVQVVDRLRDLGVLQAVGATAGAITGIYLRIGSAICLTGIVVGLVVGIGFSLNLHWIERWVFILTGWEVFPREIYYIDSIPVKIVPSDIAFIVVPTILAGFVASYTVARRAARKDPVEALSHE